MIKKIYKINIMDNYTYKYDEKSLKNIAKLIDKNGIDKCMLTTLILSRKEDDIREKYIIIYRGVCEQYMTIKYRKNISNKEEEMITNLITTFCQLDEECGINEYLVNGQTEEEIQRILKLLDADLDKFIRYIITCL